MNWTASEARVNAPAKLNLSLHIRGRRADGYHLLDSIVAPITIFDRVTVRVTPSAHTTVSVRCTPAGAATSRPRQPRVAGRGVISPPP
jgi:4-diphosphocytidyl-2-C-methyl-D-erythritol kinase